MSVKQAALDLDAIVRSLDSQKPEQLESIAANLPHVLSLLNLDKDDPEIDILLLKLHTYQRCFYHLHQLSSEYGDTGITADELLVLSIYTDIAFELLRQANTIFRLAIETSIPKPHLFAVYHTIYLIVCQDYRKIASVVGVESIQGRGNQIIEELLVSHFLTVFSMRPSSSLQLESFNISFTLSLLIHLLKDSFQQQKRNISVAASLFINSFVLQESLQNLFSYLILDADGSLLSRIAPPILDAMKLAKKIAFIPTLQVSESLLIPSLLENDDSEQLRDALVARKLFSVLKIEFDELGGNFADQISAKFLHAPQRVISLIFSSNNGTIASKSEYSGVSLLSKRYNANISNETSPSEMDALRRSVLVYTLKVVGKVLTSSIDPHPALASQLLLLTRTLVGQGLFSVNPAASFLDLVAHHDAHLLEGLYWSQQLLLCGYQHFHPSHRDDMSGVTQQPTLIGQLCDKVPQLSVFLSVLNPYSLFVAFLDFLKYDHSIMVDFMLSSESEWFLRYLLDFVKFCLVDWNRTFIALYNLKSKSTTTDFNSAQAKMSSEEIDSLLEHLLEKQMKEMQLDPMEIEADNDSLHLDPGSSQEPTTTDIMLASNHAHQNTFDAVISCLVRLLFHLEAASEHELIGYNIEPLLARLRELERHYEKSDFAASSTHR